MKADKLPYMARKWRRVLPHASIDCTPFCLRKLQRSVYDSDELQSDAASLKAQEQLMMEGGAVKLLVDEIAIFGNGTCLQTCTIKVTNAKMESGDGDISHLESRSTNLDDFLSGITTETEVDSVPDLQEQVTWLKVEAEELETAPMEMVKQDNRWQLSARKSMEAGCFSVVLECVLAPVAAAATFALRITIIDIGVGPFCIGQVN
ncbi:unnamed protein product [Camellia sinensis]